MAFGGRYVLDGKLGSGGMGMVYKARPVDGDGEVAIKVVHPSLSDSAPARTRFECEVLATARVAHPNCVGLYESGKLPDGSSYMAMEMLDGKPLSELLAAERRLAPARALRILAHVLRGLTQIHSARLVHRDIKPENIILVKQGDDVDFAKIIDFGLAKGMVAAKLDAGVKLETFGMTFGTPTYMAPEQGAGKTFDGRADLYAASVVAYEMLCGQPPFRHAERRALLAMHATTPVPAMRERVLSGAAVPPVVEKLVMRGLSKDPGARWPTASAYLAAVERTLRVLDGAPEVSEVLVVPTTMDLAKGITNAIEEALAPRRSFDPSPSALRPSLLFGDLEDAGARATLRPSRLQVVRDALPPPRPAVAMRTVLPSPPPHPVAGGTVVSRRFRLGRQQLVVGLVVAICAVIAAIIALTVA